MMDAGGLLLRLGVTPEYKGFAYFLCALEICRTDPEARHMLTKRLYPAVAARYVTSWQAVERDLRTAVATAWATDEVLLRDLAGFPLIRRPTVSQFLGLLMRCEAAKLTGETARRGG